MADGTGQVNKDPELYRKCREYADDIVAAYEGDLFMRDKCGKLFIREHGKDEAGCPHCGMVYKTLSMGEPYTIADYIGKESIDHNFVIDKDGRYLSSQVIFATCPIIMLDTARDGVRGFGAGEEGWAYIHEEVLCEIDDIMEAIYDRI